MKEDTETHEHHHEHEKYDEFWFTSDKEINLHKFIEVMNNLPDNVIRSKGYVNSQGKKVLIQYVPRTLQTSESEWKKQNPETAVLFLGKKLNTESLTKLLSDCETH